MRPRSIALLLYLVFASPAFPQTQSDSKQDSGVKPPKHRPVVADKKFWAFATVQVLAAAADFESTQAALRADSQAQELNPFFGGRPSRAKLYGVGMPLTAFQIFLQYRSKQIGENAERGKNLWLVGASIDTGLHTFLAVHNAQISNQRVCPAQGAGCR